MYKIPSFESNPVIQSRVDEMILDELKNYLDNPENIDRIEKPSVPLPEFPDFPITQEEIELVAVDEVMAELSAPVKKDLEEIFSNTSPRYNVNDFVSRKLIQLIKLVKAERAYVPDLFGEMLLMQIAEDSLPGEEKCPEEWKQFAKIYAESCIEDDEDIDIGKEIYESALVAGQSLWDMYSEDLNYEHGFLLWDTDFSFLINNGLLEGLLILAGPMLGYSSKDYYQIFTSVGYNVPAKIAVMGEVREEYWKES